MNGAKNRAIKKLPRSGAPTLSSGLGIDDWYNVSGRSPKGKACGRVEFRGNHLIPTLGRVGHQTNIGKFGRKLADEYGLEVGF